MVGASFLLGWFGKTYFDVMENKKRVKEIEEIEKTTGRRPSS